jgi:hypothetical protein
MEEERRKQTEIPSPTECPGKFCFFWLERGSRFAKGLYNDLDEALNHTAIVQDNQCGCSFGICRRLDPGSSNKDWYEPNEVRLEEAGLPWFYFISSP